VAADALAPNNTRGITPMTATTGRTAMQDAYDAWWGRADARPTTTSAKASTMRRIVAGLRALVVPASDAQAVPAASPVARSASIAPPNAA
jgi:hypothetical protein